MKKEEALQQLIERESSRAVFVFKHSKRGFLKYCADPFTGDHIGWTKFKERATCFSSHSDSTVFMMALHKRLLKKLTAIPI